MIEFFNLLEGFVGWANQRVRDVIPMRIRIKSNIHFDFQNWVWIWLFLSSPLPSQAGAGLSDTWTVINAHFCTDPWIRWPSAETRLCAMPPAPILYARALPPSEATPLPSSATLSLDEAFALGTLWIICKVGMGWGEFPSSLSDNLFSNWLLCLYLNCAHFSYHGLFPRAVTEISIICLLHYQHIHSPSFFPHSVSFPSSFQTASILTL